MSDNKDTGYSGISAPGAPPKTPCIAAFVVVILPDGSIRADLEGGIEYEAERPATMHDVGTAGWSLSIDYAAIKAASHTIQAQMQVAQQMQQQAATAQILQNIKGDNKPPRRG